METRDPDAAARPAPPPEPTLAWPPPGLERMYGDANMATRWLAAGAFLILPLVYTVVANQDAWSLGPLGGSLWVAFLPGIVGIPILVGGYVVLGRLLRRSWQALDGGHQLRTVLLVAVDHRRDTGFLLQGAREYRLLSEATRRRLGTLRIAVGALLLFAGLWVSLGFGVAVVLAARGVVGPWGVVLLVGVPSFLAGAVGTITYGWEEGILRRVRKRWYGRPRTREKLRAQVQAWQSEMAERVSGMPDPEALSEPRGRARAALRVSYVLVAVATVLAFVPVFTLVFSAAIIPVLAQISEPRMEGVVSELAAAEPLRAYVLEPDTSISPAEAGAILHTLSFVGRPYRATEGVLPPAREYPAPWFPLGDAPLLSMATLADSLIEGMGRPVSPAESSYLAVVASHPAHRELARLARAGGLDITSARWSLPLPSGITLTELAMPTMGSVRTAGYAHLAMAALEASRGDVAAADTTIREVLSVGLLMADESPAVLDNVIGLSLADRAGAALTALYRNTGRPEGDALTWGMAAAERSVARARTPVATDVGARLEALPHDVLDTTYVRGLRWEYVALLNTLGPCLNLRRVVFGPDLDYRSWLDRARDELVRYPAEAELFEVAREGLLGGGRDDPAPLATRLLGLTMGDATRPGSCARVLGEAVGF